MPDSKEDVFIDKEWEFKIKYNDPTLNQSSINDWLTKTAIFNGWTYGGMYDDFIIDMPDETQSKRFAAIISLTFPNADITYHLYEDEEGSIP